MIIGLILILIGNGAAAFAAWGDNRFLAAVPVATLLGMALVRWSAGREIPESRPRAQGFAAAVLTSTFAALAFVMWLVTLDDASTGMATALMVGYGVLAVVYGIVAGWRALGVMAGWI
jgi:hypothetical protein